MIMMMKMLVANLKGLVLGKGFGDLSFQEILSWYVA